MFRNVRPEFTQRDYESAIVKLAFLKENAKFCEFLSNLNKNPYLICPQFRKPKESDLIYRMRLLKINCNPPNELESDLKHFDINYRFVSLVQKDGDISTQEILDLLDPRKTVEYSTDNSLIALLPLLFYSQGVYGFKFSRGSVDRSCLPTYERLVKIDLRKRKSQLVKEFEQYVKHESNLHFKRSQTKLGNSYLNPDFIWHVENSRNRKEALKQLEVWRLRKMQVRQYRLSFKEIARKQNESIDTVKRRFYKAYERIYGKNYDPNIFQKLAKRIRIDELKKTCQDCTDRDCKDNMTNPQKWSPCPDVLPYINQDKIKLKESILIEYSDSYIDFLQSK